VQDVWYGPFAKARLPQSVVLELHLQHSHNMFTSIKNLFGSRKAKADQAIQDAQMKTQQVEEKLRNTISECEMELMHLQARLHGCLQSMAPKSEIAKITKRIQIVNRTKAETEGKLANVHKESRQLNDATINVEVIQTMNDSVRAQRMLERAVTDNDIDDVDDLLDDVEEKRAETKELGERLGSLGNHDEDFDEDSILSEDVMQAMGWSTQREDQQMFANVKQRMQLTRDMQKAYMQDAAPSEPQNNISEESFPQAPVSYIAPRKIAARENKTGWNF